MTRNERRKHYGLENAVEIPDQHPRTEPRKIPRDKVLEMMIKESELSTTSPRIRCERCGVRLIQNGSIRISFPT